MKRALLSVFTTVVLLFGATAARADYGHHGSHGYHHNNYGHGHCYNPPRVNYYTPGACTPPCYSAPCYSPPPCYAAAPACPSASCEAAAAPQQPSAADPSVSVLISLLAELLKANATSAGR
jgi:hypothetical protein